MLVSSVTPLSVLILYKEREYFLDILLVLDMKGFLVFVCGAVICGPVGAGFGDGNVEGT